MLTAFGLMILLIIAVAVIVGVVIAVAVLGSKKETHFGGESYFDGNTWQLIGYRILSFLVCTVTLGIAYPWMLCTVQRWEVRHTVIHGRRLKFNGHGHQLIGKYLLWVLLTVITCGIYSIWLGLGMKKWVVKHTVYADETQPEDSYFSGGAGGYLGVHLLAFLLTVFTLGIGKAWGDTAVLKWEAKHTHIGGSPMVFYGTGGQLFVKYLLLVLLTPLTLGLYALFFTVVYMKWQVKHTEAVYQTPAVQAQARAHEAAAVQDHAKFRIAANDAEIAAMKSGYTGKEDTETLRRMAEEGNPFACYRLAAQLKGDTALYEGDALEWLQKAADGNYHAALLDLGRQSAPEQAVSLLTAAAQRGSAEAARLLAIAYTETDALTTAAYWFRVALEWEVPQAVEHAADYEALIDRIARRLSEQQSPSGGSPVLPIVLGVAGGVLLLAVAAVVVVSVLGGRLGARPAEVTTEDTAMTPDDVDGNWKIYYAELVQSRPIEQLRGEETDALDYEGNTLHYIFDENMFFDYEEQVLYFEFGVIEYAFPICITDKVEWQSGELKGSGIFKVHYPYGMAPDAVAVRGETFISRDDTVNITRGTTAEANEWLAARYVFEESVESTTTTTTTTEATTTTATTAATVNIVGAWEWFEIYTDLETGDTGLELKRWLFRADGTCDVIQEYYYPSEDNSGEYYGGMYWHVGSGNGSAGHYTLNADELTVTIVIQDLDYTEEITSVYMIELDGDQLFLYSTTSDRTEVFWRAEM